jgi:hypothetical protein
MGKDDTVCISGNDLSLRYHRLLTHGGGFPCAISMGARQVSAVQVEYYAVRSWTGETGRLLE